MSAARDAVLASIRSALGPSPDVPEIPRAYRGAGSAAADADVVALFCERVADYRATVTRCSRDELPAALARACAARGTGRVVSASGFGMPLDGVQLTNDDPSRPPVELDEIDAALTGCALGIAETGSIVLDGAGPSGRRALTLVPDHHLCVVRVEQIVAAMPDAIAALHEAASDGRPITFISGPSATSDIELERVEGVHGPRQLDVFVVSA